MVIRRLALVVAIAGLLGVGPPEESGGEFLGAASARPVSAASARSVSSATCRRRARVVRVRLSRARWPHIAAHVAAVDQDYPRRLHIDRGGADANRVESLRGIPTRLGMDRDEYPPAMAREGGAGADVRYAPSSENRSAGASMGARLERFCEGQRFRLVVRP